MKRVTEILGPYIMHYDFMAGLLVFIVSIFMLPSQISSLFAKDIYGVAITVLSIIFSIFFTALTIIITSSDDAFIKWLVKNNYYKELTRLFKFTLTLLFIALVSALVLYLVTAGYIADYADSAVQSKWWLIVFSSLFAWSLIATGSSSLDAIKYAERRAIFLCAQSENKNYKSNDEE